MKETAASQSSTKSSGFSLRALLTATVLVGLVNLWVLITELRTGSYATGGTPPATAIGGLLLLLAFNPLLRRFHREYSRAEILIIYAFLCIAIPMAGIGVVRAFVPHTTVLKYFAMPENRFQELDKHLPWWQKVTNPQIVRQCYEGAPDKKVPWRPWLPPLTRWFTFFAAIFAAITSLLTIFRKQWVEHEHLSFPLLEMPLRLIQGATLERPALLRDPVFYVGFVAAFLYHALNVLKAAHLIDKAPGLLFNLDPVLSGRPWNALVPLHLYNMPQIVGLGYFVSLEISFSVWFFYWLERLVGTIGVCQGYQIVEFPYMIQQSAGGYMAFGLLLCYTARRHLRDVIRKALFNDPSVDDSAEPMSYRLALIVFVAAMAYLVFWCTAAGMVWWLATLYMGFIAIFALVYGRIRAETGVPYAILYPLGEPKNLMLDALGALGWVKPLGVRNLVVFSSLSWLSRHYYPEFMAAYQMDGLKIAEAARVHRRAIVRVMVTAMVVGLVFAFWSHLTAYYRYGENNVDSATGGGDPRAMVALGDYKTAETFLWGALPPMIPHLTSAAVGFLFTAALFFARVVAINSPFHPMGFLMATCYGAEGPMWWSFFIVWVMKGLILRYGSVKLYRRLAPAFVGLALGHFFWGGLVWGNLCSLPFVPAAMRLGYMLPRV
ncbi:MAG: hypothetical protein COZ05_19920 [Armatimonadetes bacterium CG_4_10_14_3_um_filter_59_10]|nr:MAG: hypothetical protein COZ05_19920 [Armatimonadetes bacterium CG_4_10_14_3_um_filter_59_10]